MCTCICAVGITRHAHTRAVRSHFDSISGRGIRSLNQIKAMASQLPWEDEYDALYNADPPDISESARKKCWDRIDAGIPWSWPWTPESVLAEAAAAKQEQKREPEFKTPPLKKQRLSQQPGGVDDVEESCKLKTGKVTDVKVCLATVYRPIIIVHRPTDSQLANMPSTSLL